MVNKAGGKTMDYRRLKIQLEMSESRKMEGIKNAEAQCRARINDVQRLHKERERELVAVFLCNMIPHEMEQRLEPLDKQVSINKPNSHESFKLEISPGHRAWFLFEEGRKREALCYYLLAKGDIHELTRFMKVITANLFKDLAEEGEWNEIAEWIDCLHFYGF